MPVSKAQQAATARYEDKAYDKVLVRLPKGQKEIMQAYAEAHTESVNGFINRAIFEAMEREKAVPGAAPPATGPKANILSPDTLQAAQEAAQAAGEAVTEFIARAVDTQAQRDKLTRGIKGIE